MRKIVFFDGICHLCNGFVDTIISLDKNHLLEFAPLQGSTAETVLTCNDRAGLDTIVFLEEEKTFYKSTAIIKILISLGGFFKILYLAYLIPRPVRDALYNYCAKNRYAWLGKRDFCRLPKPEEKNYLLP